MALYCFVLEYNYKKIQNELIGFHPEISLTIQDIEHNELKNNYKISGHVLLKESKKWARIQIFLKNKPTFELGDRVEFKNLTFKEPTNNEYKKYLLKECIHATTYCTSVARKSIDHQENGIVWIKKYLARLQQKISQKLSQQTATLFSSLFLVPKSIQRLKIKL